MTPLELRIIKFLYDELPKQPEVLLEIHMALCLKADELGIEWRRGEYD